MFIYIIFQFLIIFLLLKKDYKINFLQRSDKKDYKINFLQQGSPLGVNIL